MYNPIKKDEYPEEMTFEQIEELFKNIGDKMRCKNCRYWKMMSKNNMAMCDATPEDFGCIHWESKE